MTLAISDTYHLTGDRKKKDFLPYEEIPLDHYLSDNEQQEDGQPLTQQADAVNSADAGMKILQDFTAQQQKAIDAAAPVYDIDREKRLQRIGKTQKFADALTVLGQVIGAGAGASVAPMQMNNSAEASNIIQKLRETYENDDRRHKLLSLQQQLRGSEIVSNELSRRQQVKESEASYAERIRLQAEKDAERLRLQNDYANDPNSIENKIKLQQAHENKRYNDSRIAENNASVASKNAYSEYIREKGGSETATGKTPYLSLYDDVNSAPVFNIMDEGQARAIFNQILAKNPKAVELSKYRSYGTSESPSKAEIDAVISKYWKSVINVKPAEKPSWLPSQNRTEGQEYRPAAVERKENAVKWLSSPENQKNLDDFVAKVEMNYPGQTSTQKAAIRTYLVKNAGFELQEANRIVDDYFTNIED